VVGLKPVVAIIELDRLEMGSLTPRLSFDEGWVRELAEDIKRNGQIKPIIVRPHPSKPAFYQVVDGEHRVRAMMLLGEKAIRAEVHQLNDSEAALLAMRVNELHGKRLSEIEEGIHMLRLRREFGWTEEEMAERIGRSRQWVSDRIRVAENAHEELLRMHAAGKITLAQAREIVELPREEQPRVARKVVEEDLTSRQTTLLTHALKKAEGEEERERILRKPVKVLAEAYRREEEKVRETLLSEKDEIIEVFACPDCGRKAVVNWVDRRLDWGERS
jgi:ParB family chromosome partitioning protein